MMFMYSYNENSASAKALAAALLIKRIKHEGSAFVGGANKIVINWGSSTLPEEVIKSKVINKPDKVAGVSNKRSFFDLMKQKAVDDYVVSYTTDINTARSWYGEGLTVVARTVLQGHSGDGIVLLNKEENDFIDAPLYTIYKPKKDEYRIHLVKNGYGDVMAFSVQRKARNLDVPKEQVNWKIRNHGNGFIYQREDFKVPECVLNCAYEVFRATGLDFGAIDIIYNERESRAYALEVNTAPGLEGSTCTEYANAISGIKDTLF